MLNSKTQLIQYLKNNFPELFLQLQQDYSAHDISARNNFQMNTGRMIRAIGIEGLRHGTGPFCSNFRREYDPAIAAAEMLPEGGPGEDRLEINDYLTMYSKGNTYNEDLILNAVCECLNISIFLITTRVDRTTGQLATEFTNFGNPNSPQLEMHLSASKKHYFINRNHIIDDNNPVSAGDDGDIFGDGNCSCNSIAELLHIIVQEEKSKQNQYNQDARLAESIMLSERQEAEKPKQEQVATDLLLARSIAIHESEAPKINTALQMQVQAINKGGIFSRFFSSSCSTTTPTSMPPAPPQAEKQESYDRYVAETLCVEEYDEYVNRPSLFGRMAKSFNPFG